MTIDLGFEFFVNKVTWQHVTVVMYNSMLHLNLSSKMGFLKINKKEKEKTITLGKTRC